MCKQIQISAFVFLFSVSFSLAENNYWNDSTGNHSWNSSGNWSLNRVPVRDPYSTGATYNDYAFINYISTSPNGCVHNSGNNYVHSIWIARYGFNNAPAILNMEGGSISAYWIIRLGDDNESGTNATLNMTGGTLDCTTNQGLEIGYSSRATLNLFGGTINAGPVKISNSTYKPQAVFNLYGGVLNCSSFVINDANGLMNVTWGTLVVDGNAVNALNSYINSGQIIAFSNDPAASCDIDFNISTAGKTTLKARTTLDWTGTASTKLWTDLSNWAQFNVPDSNSERCQIDAPAGADPNGPIIQNGMDIHIWRLQLGAEHSGTAHLKMTGGSLSIERYPNPDLEIGYTAGGGYFEISGGTVNVLNALVTGSSNSGVLNIRGGTVNVDNVITVAKYSGSSGIIYLNGGTLSSEHGLSIGSGSGLIDIGAGTLILTGDRRSTLQPYIDAGNIVAYGGSKMVHMDYNIAHSGKTTLTAGTGIATKPVPYSGCSGVYTNIRLRWQPGAPNETFNVYFGTNSTDVSNATTSTPGIYKGNSSDASYSPSSLNVNTTYYWRVDEVGTQTSKGAVWNFKTTKFMTTYSFESTPPNYTINSSYGGITSDSSEIINGQYSLEIDSMANGGTADHTVFETSNSSGVAFEGGKRYSISYKYKVIDVNTNNSNCYFYSVMHSDSNAGPDYNRCQWRENCPDGSNWHEMKVILPPGINDYKLRFGVRGQGHGIIDDILIQELPSLNWDDTGVTVADTHYEPYGICNHLNRIDTYYESGVSDAEMRQLVDKMADAGIQWFRVNLPWYGFEISKGVYDQNCISRMDDLINYSLTKGVTPYLQIGGTPTWARAEDGDAPDNMDDWAEHVFWAANRYKSKIDHWEIRNEFNGKEFWESSIEKYVEFLKVAHDEIKSVDPNNKIILGGLSKDGVFLYSFGDGFDEHGLEKAYMIDGFKESFDIFSLHPYCSRFYTRSNQNPLLSRYDTLLEEVLDLCNTAFRTIDKYNDGEKPIWITEQMVSTAGDSTLLTDQANALQKIFTKLIMHPRIEKIFFYQLYQGDTTVSSDNAAIINHDMTNRAAYVTYQNMVKSQIRKVNYNLEMDPFAAVLAASNPIPQNSSVLIGVNEYLSWVPVENSTFRKVYFGTNVSDVSSRASGVLKTTQTSDEYAPGTLDPNMVYYWAIDCNDGKKNWPGHLWNFKTVAPWKVRMYTVNGVNYVSVDNGVIYADFQSNYAWTMKNLRYRGRNILCGISGVYNGAVVNVDPDSTWIGTGHGGEVIANFKVNVNGTDYSFVNGNSYTGKVITIVKDSEMGPLDHNARIMFVDSGDYLLERHKFTVVEDLSTRFNYLYAFMHGFDNTFKQYLALTDNDGHWITGTSIKDNDAFVLNGDVQAVSLFSPSTHSGVTCAYPQMYAGENPLYNAIWDRVNNNKLYFRADVLGSNYNIGDSFEYYAKLIPFDAESWNWKDLSKDYSAWGLYQAESAVKSGATTNSSYAGYTGSGYVTFVNVSNDYIQWTADVDTTGTYFLEFRYALASGTRPLRLTVNGTVVESSLAFPATGQWTAWNTVVVPVKLQSGTNNNTIRVTAIGSGGPNIDHLTVSKIPGIY